MRGIKDLREFLLGEWTVVRQVFDRRLGVRGEFTGRAGFSGEGDVLRYEEVGVLRFAGRSHRASRELTYTFTRPEHAEVSFSDGTPFHHLDLSRGRCCVTYNCGADVYRGEFAVVSAAEWRSVWGVTGPRKNQVLETRFGRGPAEDT